MRSVATSLVPGLLIIWHGRYLLLYASVVYNQNEHLVAKNMTPIKIISVAIGTCVLLAL